MSVSTQQYIRKPLYVDAVRVSSANFDEIAIWCQGQVQEDDGPKGTGKKFIRIRVHNPINPRQTQAFVGDWILYTEKGYKIYSNQAFRASFDQVGQENPPYPYPEGDTLVLGPECFVSVGGEVLNWRGTNYVPQGNPDDVVMGSEELVPGVTLNDVVRMVREGELGLVRTNPDEIKKAIIEKAA